MEHLKIWDSCQRWASDCPQDKWISLSWLSRQPVCSLHTHPRWEEAIPHPGPRKRGWHPRRVSITARICFRRLKAVVRVVIYNQSGGGTSLVVQWLPHCTPNAGDPGSIPGQGTRSHMLTTKSSHVLQLKDKKKKKDLVQIKKQKIPHTLVKTQFSRINRLIIFLNKEKWSSGSGEGRPQLKPDAKK